MTAEKQGRKAKATEIAKETKKPVERKKKRSVKEIHCKDCRFRKNSGLAGLPIDSPRLVEAGRGWCSYLERYVPRKVVDNKFPCDGEGFKSKG